MTAEDPSSWQDIAVHLHQSGYLLVPRWHRDQTTIDIGRSIGTVVDIRALLPRSSIPTVQTLRPRHKSESPSNQYSGTYGLSDFPLHTDLAHWALPPRYFVLRCKIGSPAVITRLLPSSALASTLGTVTLRRALVRPRHSGQSGKHCLLPLMFPARDTFGLRWDPLFLVPMNGAARRLAEVMLTNAWDQTKLVKLALTSPGDTLIVDNWRFLHGRSSVPAADVDRRLERIYLSEIHT